VVQSAIALADRGPFAPAAVTEVGDDLLEVFGWVPDGRSGQARDHPVAAVLALAAAAVVAGMKGYTAISGCVKDVPPSVLADLYLRAGARPARPPSKATIWRVITDADAGVDALPWDQVPIAHAATDRGHGRITPAPSRCRPRPRTCRSRTSARCT
jgi:DDE_Tnp_1-associated